MSVTSDEKVHFNLEQVAAIEEAFAHFDVNNDGLISLPEFRGILTSLGDAGAGHTVTDSEIAERIREWDGDGDGSINFAEFLDAMTKILTDTDNEVRLREAFRLFDKVGGVGHGVAMQPVACSRGSSISHTGQLIACRLIKSCAVSIGQAFKL